MCVVMYRLVIYRLSKEASMFKVKKSFSNALVVMEGKQMTGSVCVYATVHITLHIILSSEIQRTLLGY